MKVLAASVLAVTKSHCTWEWVSGHHLLPLFLCVWILCVCVHVCVCIICMCLCVYLCVCACLCVCVWRCVSEGVLMYYNDSVLYALALPCSSIGQSHHQCPLLLLVVWLLYVFLRSMGCSLPHTAWRTLTWRSANVLRWTTTTPIFC